MNDNYMHNSHSVMYVEESIPGPPEDSKEYEELINAFNSQITKCCSCKDNCLSKCVCQDSYGGLNYRGIGDTDNPQYILNYEVKDFKSHPLIECNKLCQCPMKCGNRVVQLGPCNKLIVNPCVQPSKGLGLFANSFILAGTFICEYAGELITKKQALYRLDQNKVEGKMNYIYCLNEYTHGKPLQTFIDPSQFGNIGRYINHSCEPNCVIIPVRVNTPIPKLAIFSVMDIPTDMEITFDYGASGCNNSSANKKDRKRCLCISRNCRGWLPFDNY